MYKIIDLQGEGTMETRKFKNKKEILEALASYHDINFTGTDDKNNELNIRDYFKFWKIDTTKKQLEFLLQYGEWDIKKIKKRGLK